MLILMLRVLESVHDVIEGVWLSLWRTETRRDIQLGVKRVVLNPLKETVNI